MKRTFTSAILLCLLAVCTFTQTTEFTYQGRLLDNALPATANYDFEFSLWDSLVAGTQAGTTQTNGGVVVANGIFTVRLDFGAQLTGAARFLQIAVRPAGGGAYTTLAPRQPITSAPYSIRSSNAGNADALSPACSLCVTDAQISGLDGSKITGSVANAVNAINATTANNVTGVVAIANGGTGSSTKNFVDLSTNQTVGGDKTFTGMLSGNGSGLTNVLGTFKWNEVTGTALQAASNNGYVTINNSQVTVTLPASPSLGDTVRVTSAGLGGWKIAQNAGQSINGFHYGTVGSVWTPRESPREWRATASSADGEKLVAAVQGGQIYTSTDGGVTWMPRETNRNWWSLASSADGQKLVAGVIGGQLYTSTDAGVTWTPRETNRSWYSVASSADGQKLAAVTLSDNDVYVSDDGGVTWAPRFVTSPMTGVAMSADGQRLFVAKQGLAPNAYISTDGGVTWAPRTVAASLNSEPKVASSGDGTKLFVAGSNGVFSSVDSGATWVAGTGYPMTFTFGLATSGDGTRAVIAGSSSFYTGVQDTSAGAPPGRYVWTQRFTAGSVSSVTSSADGLRLAGTSSSGGRIFTSSLLTTPGTAGFVTGDYGASIELQYVGVGRWLPISSIGPIKFF